MCLGQIGEVVDLLDDGSGLVRVDGVVRGVSLITLVDAVEAVRTVVRPGDWLVVHCGFALARLTPDEARDALELRASPVPDPARHTSTEVRS